jgi:hypothetical protein
MEENKYYTPTAEEFHIGFEYEINTTYKVYDQETLPEWIKASITKENWQSNMDCINLLKRVRVKHLDREAIESLGWKYVPEEDRYVIETDDNHFWMEDFDENSFTVDETHYILKNKSELKKLMQQKQIP